MKENHILIVDDDDGLRELLGSYLREHNFRVSSAVCVAQALYYLKSCHFDLIVLDLMLPGESGIDLLEKIKYLDAKVYHLPPVLMLTARQGDDDKINALENGADDYLGKPFNPYEIILRARAIIRRTGGKEGVKKGEGVRFGPFFYDPKRGTLWLHNAPVPLTFGENQLLCKLASQKGHIIERGNRALDVQMNRLRQKIGDDSKHPLYLQTLRNKGYVLRVDS